MFSDDGIYPVVTNSSSNNGITGYTNLNANEKGNIITYSDTTTSEGIFYQPRDFVGYSHIQGLYPKVFRDKWNYSSLMYVLTCMRKAAAGKFDYGNKFNRKIASELIIQIPIKDGKIDFDFIDKFIAEVEKRYTIEFKVKNIEIIKEYFNVCGLKNYELSSEEKEAIELYNKIEWGTFNVKNLFGKATRGKRLKSSDRIDGNLPFVTAGETNEGISAYIGNKVEIFEKNTLTIDMFGSTKYRNYKYGADDHIAVVHTEQLDKFSSLFVSTAIHKSSYTGKFNYSRNFYAKDADELYIRLPVNNNSIDYYYMKILISAVQKLVIKDIILEIQEKENIIMSIIK